LVKLGFYVNKSDGKKGKVEVGVGIEPLSMASRGVLYQAKFHLSLKQKII